MNTLKDIFKINWYVIATTLMLAVCSEVLCGIMNYNLNPDGIYVRQFLSDLCFKGVALVGGVVFCYFLGGLLNHEASGIIAIINMFLTVVFSGIIFYGTQNYNIYRICLIISLLSLSFYYINKCLDSVMHTVFYYVMMTALAFFSTEEIEFFIVLTVAVVTFATKRIIVRSTFSLILNYVWSVLAVIAMICMLVEKMDNYLGILYIEGPRYHSEAALLSLEPFATAKYFSQIASAPSVYNLTKIFGYFGKCAGIAVCVVMALFTVSVFIKCFHTSGFPRSVDIVAAIAIAVRCFAGFFENFTIVSGLQVRIPIVSDDITGYLIIGILLGMMFAPRKRLNLMQGMFKGFLKTTEYNDDFEENDYVQH